MRKFRKGIAAWMVVFMFVTMLPESVFAAEPDTSASAAEQTASEEPSLDDLLIHICMKYVRKILKKEMQMYSMIR